MKYSPDFYKGKRVLITGHTGFKGSWMCETLLLAGAEVTGYALEPAGEPNLFQLLGLSERMHSVIGDIRDLEHLQSVMKETNPEIVIHMAAQPIVRESYKNPVYTYETNVMGTVNLLESVRSCDSVKSVVNVTTDKVYRNREWPWGYRENEELNGYDPYSNSKSCSELVTSSYKNAFFNDGDHCRVAVSTCRAGNVIGGGDYAVDRIIPDCIRAALNGTCISVRNPDSIRPYQHVLEPVIAYLMIAQAQYNDPSLAGSYNIGPDEVDFLTTGELADRFCRLWNQNAEAAHLPLASWMEHGDGGPHEANILKLDCSKIKSTFGWKPRWHGATVIAKIVEWEIARNTGKDIREVTQRQIESYLDTTDKTV